MGKVILTHLENIDQQTTFESIKIAEDIGKEAITYVLQATPENITKVENSGRKTYIPETLWNFDLTITEPLYVYFDLENYPFYQKAKEVIQREGESKGVFRYRRMITQDGSMMTFAGDLYVLLSLLGKPQHVQVKQTNRSTIPSHQIMMINFGGGVMAHIEYTISDQEKIELEWSGIQHIVEFNSDEFKPIQPGYRTKLPLKYSIDSILEHAHKVDTSFMEQMSYCYNLINRGDEI